MMVALQFRKGSYNFWQDHFRWVQPVIVPLYIALMITLFAGYQAFIEERILPFILARAVF